MKGMPRKILVRATLKQYKDDFGGRLRAFFTKNFRNVEINLSKIF